MGVRTLTADYWENLTEAQKKYHLEAVRYGK